MRDWRGWTKRGLKGGDAMDRITVQLLGCCIATIIPLLFVSAVIKDKNSRRIILYFCWGTFAGLLSYFGNSFFGNAPGHAERVVTGIAPIVEELLKGIPLIFFLRRKKLLITEQIVYCAMASGASFSIQESILYYSLSTGTTGDILTLAIRTLTTALMHSMSTAIIGMGLLILQKHRYILIEIMLGLFTLSACIHALFNLLLPTKLAMAALLMPIGLFLAGLVFFENDVTRDVEEESEDIQS